MFVICITTKFSGSMQSALSARQLILDHSMQGHLLGVVAIAGLFAIWRFLYDRNEERARLERILEHIRAKEETNQPLNI